MAFVWAQPDQVMIEAPDVRCMGWLRYSADRATWRRVADLRSEPDAWLLALTAYGPLSRFDERVPEERVRTAWAEALRGLAAVAGLWVPQGADGIFALPDAHPVELTGAYRVLQSSLNALVVDASVRLVVRGLELIPESVTLGGFLWLTAAEAVRDKYRFRRCERCKGWMRIQRTDARFCSAACRNARVEAGNEAVAG